MTTTVSNPVLTGFHADPSILRVNDTYYIANSTFEYFPGVRIHKSKDLVNWEFASAPLSTKLLDMKGNPQSGGIWAPCLTYSDGLFYLVFTDVKMWNNDTPYKDSPNYLTTAKDIEGPWSEPIYLNSSGFDGSMFHKDDGTKWYMNMLWDHRKEGIERFAGIVIQQYDPDLKKLIGERKLIYRGSPIGLTEGPHIYKRNGYYYLLMAEGGTSYQHAATVVRSKNLLGPYELPEKYPLITGWEKNKMLQKCGHGSLMEDEFGNWYLAYLCGRPLPKTPFCNLGRETSIANVVWENDWPKLKNGTNEPDDTFESPYNAEKINVIEKRYTFQNTDFLKDFQTLRVPFSDDVYKLEDSCLIMRGRESILSQHEQSIVIRRQTDFKFTAETKVTFSPSNFQKMAGMSYRYDEFNQYCFYMSYDEETQGNVLELIKVDHGKTSYESTKIGKIQVNTDTIYLKLCVDYKQGQFYYSLDGDEWVAYGGKIDVTILSDDYVQPMGFTGAFVGMCCQDLDNKTAKAKFHYFIYKKGHK